jgi:predicted PurR-regulated permease PerM
MVFSVLVAYVIVGLADQLARLPGLGARLPEQLRFALSILVIALALAWVAGLVVAYAGRVVALAPQFQATLATLLEGVADRFGLESVPTLGSLRQDLFGDFNLHRVLSSTVVSVTSALATVMLVFLYVAFLLVERKAYPGKLANLSPDAATRERIDGILRDVNARIGRYLALKTLINLLLGLVSWAIMAFAGLELAAFWAALIALLNYVPYLGSFLGVLFPAAFALMQFGEPGPVVGLLLALSVAQMLIGNVLDPWVMGRSLNLSPFVILASLAIWATLWGIPGAFLAVPVTAVLVLVCAGFPATRSIAVLLSRNGTV